MCENPVPCACTLEKRAKARAEHMQRHDALGRLAHDLYTSAAITEDEMYLLYRQAEKEWDDAIHIASPNDPLVSLCGLRGRNLSDLPERPDSIGGCWTCLIKSEPETGDAGAAHLADSPVLIGAASNTGKEPE